MLGVKLQFPTWRVHSSPVLQSFLNIFPSVISVTYALYRKKHTNAKCTRGLSVDLELFVYWHFLELGFHYSIPDFSGFMNHDRQVSTYEAMLTQTEYHCGLKSAAVRR